MKAGDSYLFLLAGVLLLNFVVAAPILTGVNAPNSSNADTITLIYNITESNLKQGLFNWNGTNYSTSNFNGLLGICNMNNLSSLGENNTKIHCWDETVGFNITPTGAVPTANGRYDGGYYLDGNGDYLNLGSVTSNYGISNQSSNNNFTIGMWIKLDNTGGTHTLYDFGYDFNFQGFKVYYNSNFMNCYSRYGACGGYAVNLNTQDWSYVVWTKNGTSISSYHNSALVGSSGAINLSNMTYATFRIGSEGGWGNFLNGSIDEFMFYNRSLSATEIEGIYNAQLTKYSTGNYSVSSTQTLDKTGLNSTNPIRNYTYYACATNTTDTEVCSAEITLAASVDADTVFANFTSIIGTVNPFFYGVNDQYNQLSSSTQSLLDTNCDGVGDTPSNYTWNDILYNASMMNQIRIWKYDINLLSLSEGVYNQTEVQDLVNASRDAHNRGDGVTLVFYGTPTWLANTTTGWCNQTSSLYQGDWASCSPTNATKLAIVHNYIVSNITSSIPGIKLNVIPYNEPWHASFFLDKLSRDNMIKSIEINKIYNATYDMIKANNPGVSVGLSTYTTLQTPNMSNGFMSNFSNKMDFYGLHYYDGTSYFKNLGWNIDDVVNDLLNDCSAYSANCTKILFDEFDITIKNEMTDANYSMEIAYYYQYLLNHIPSQTQNMKFKWGARQGYGCNLPETEYPKNYPMTNEINDTVYPEFNITKNFATYHSVGSTVYNSSSDNANLQTIITKNSNGYYVTIMNIGTDSGEITINTGGTLTQITNLMNGTTYLNDSGTFNVGIIDSYEILYFGLETSGVGGLVARLKMDENSGLLAHDVSGLNNSGTINGASWANDGSLVTVISTLNYTINTGTGLLTILNSDYYWSRLAVSYNYGSTGANTGYTALGTVKTGLASFAGWIAIIVLVIAAAVVLGIIFLNLGGKRNRI